MDVAVGESRIEADVGDDCVRVGFHAGDDVGAVVVVWGGGGKVEGASGAARTVGGLLGEVVNVVGFAAQGAFTMEWTGGEQIRVGPAFVCG